MKSYNNKSDKLVRRERQLTQSIATILGIGLSATAGQVLAEEQVQNDNVEKIVVISTGIRGAERTVAESPAPIDIIGGDALLKTGRAELSEAISKLLPSFNFGTNIAGFQTTVRPLTNKGFGPAYTLVLVNGKRRHNSAPPASGATDNSGANAVDIDMIPVSAIERIEVLKDSAAAQYGSDAVAGVINIILKNNDYGGYIESSYGKLFSGQGETIKFAASHGFSLGEGGFLNLSADVRKKDYAGWIHKAYPEFRAYFEDEREAAWDRQAVKNGDPDLEAFNLAYNAEVPVADTLSLYSYGTFGQRDTAALNNYRTPNGNASIPELLPDGYFPLNNTLDTDYQVLAGGKGVLSDWDYDVSTTYGRHRNKHSSDLTINPTYGPDSPTSFEHLSTLQFEQWVSNLDITHAIGGLFGLSEPVQVSAGVEFRWERFRTFSGDPLAYTNGGYQYPATLADGTPNPLYLAHGPQPAIGAQAALTIRPEDEVDIKRNNYAVYIDFGFNPTEQWYIGTAGRFEHYDDDAGNTFSFKLNSRYELTDEVAIRGTIGSGFRAPSLPQTGYTVTDNRTALDADGNVVPALRQTAAPDSALAQVLGATPLDPEESRNAGLGITWQPARSTSLTVDSYFIEIDDRIVLTENIYDRNLGNGVVGDLLDSVGAPRTLWVNFYTNAFDTRTYGLDLVADHTTRFDNWGSIRWNLAFNYNKTTIEGVRETLPILQNAGIAVVGHAREGNLVSASPRSKWILGGKWTLDNFAINLQSTRYGSVETWQQNAVQDRKFGAKWITDLDVSWSPADTVTLSVGATNIFDERPDRNGIDNINGGQGAFGNPPFHPAGGFWYGKITYTF